tara:strand:- start:1829 stop:2185 length:357 start_codon:yes stop_codon:yes gene_type:complete
MKLPKDLVETAMNIALAEAKEGDLFRHIRKEISREYGIPHDQIENAPTVGHMVDGVYADHSNLIHERHFGKSNISMMDGGIGNDKDRQAGDLPMDAMEEAKGKFREFVVGLHTAYHNR